MLDLNQPESKKIIEGCFLIDELSSPYKGIVYLEGVRREELFRKNRLKLGRIGLLADELLSKDKKELANQNIRLLYKVLTGQISSTEEDFEKINKLLNELSNECFCCWCI